MTVQFCVQKFRNNLSNLFVLFFITQGRFSKSLGKPDANFLRRPLVFFAILILILAADFFIGGRHLLEIPPIIRPCHYMYVRRWARCEAFHANVAALV